MSSNTKHLRPRLKAIGYARVSTAEQAQEGVSLAHQTDKIERFAELHEIDLIATIADAGESAKDLDRPGIRQALLHLEEGSADGLILFKLDRLTRRLTDWCVLIDRYFARADGPELWSVSESINTRTSSGRLVLNILVTVAQWEREAIAERTKSALDQLAAQGKRRGTIPFGKDLDLATGDLVDNHREAATLALISDLIRNGRSNSEIAAALNAEGIPAKKGGCWARATIERIRGKISTGGES